VENDLENLRGTNLKNMFLIICALNYHGVVLTCFYFDAYVLSGIPLPESIHPLPLSPQIAFSKKKDYDESILYNHLYMTLIEQMVEIC
jgi:hypothetical protein